MSKKNSNTFSTEENGMAKLVMEIQSRQTDLEVVEDHVIKQVENEDTPKINVGHENCLLRQPMSVQSKFKKMIRKQMIIFKIFLFLL